MFFRPNHKIEVTGTPDIRGGSEIDAINSLSGQTFKPTDLAMVVWASEHGHRVPLLAYNGEGERVFTASTIIGAATRVNSGVSEALIQIYDSAARLIGAAEVLNRQATADVEGQGN